MIIVNSILAGVMFSSLYYFSRYPSDEELTPITAESAQAAAMFAPADAGAPGYAPIAEDPTLDLGPAFRAAVLLEVPIKNVCRGNCRGLCPVCGADRNTAPCTCETPRGDPRWKALGDVQLPRHEE